VTNYTATTSITYNIHHYTTPCETTIYDTKSVTRNHILHW